MSRRRRPEKREILPDPKFGDITLSKFMNSVMLDGKKSVAEGIVYGAFDTIETRARAARPPPASAGAPRACEFLHPRQPRRQEAVRRGHGLRRLQHDGAPGQRDPIGVF